MYHHRIFNLFAALLAMWLYLNISGQTLMPGIMHFLKIICKIGGLLIALNLIPPYDMISNASVDRQRHRNPRRFYAPGKVHLAAYISILA